MKRPEGFDPPGKQQPAPPARTASRPAKAQKPDLKPQAEPQPKQQPQLQPQRQERLPSSRAPRPDAAARADLRSAARERRRAERAEVRRFTRRARTRRIALAAVAGTVLALVGLVLVAVYSPLLALREITVDGTSRVSDEEVAAAVDGQLGIPLALIDFDRITTELSVFPLIRSYVTETVPPGTLLIHVVERQPVGTISSGGVFRLVDPAGVTVQESAERVPGVPLIELAAGDTSSAAFDAIVEVLLALPPGLLAQVDSVSAHTTDDVSLVLAGVGQSVAWGSAEDSAKKAALLAALIAVTDPALAGEFDVSAPSNGVFHPS